MLSAAGSQCSWRCCQLACLSRAVSVFVGRAQVLMKHGLLVACSSLKVCIVACLLTCEHLL